jgi:hypothetical protein
MLSHKRLFHDVDIILVDELISSISMICNSNVLKENDVKNVFEVCLRLQTLLSINMAEECRKMTEANDSGLLMMVEAIDDERSPTPVDVMLCDMLR